MKLSEEEKEKAYFLKELGNLLRRYKINEIIAIDYLIERGEEFANIQYRNGRQKKVCITGDSCWGILRDCQRQGGW